MKYERRCDCLAAENRTLTSVFIRKHRGNIYKKMRLMFSRHKGQVTRKLPYCQETAEKSCETKFVWGVFKLLFENFLVPILASTQQPGRVKGSLVCKSGRPQGATREENDRERQRDRTRCIAGLIVESVECRNLRVKVIQEANSRELIKRRLYRPSI